MKKRNTKLLNFIKGLVFGSFVVALLTLTVGCGDKKKSNSRQGAGWWGGGYNPYAPGFNTGYGGQTVAAGVSTGGQFMLILAATVQQQANPYNTGAAGPAYVEGELNIFQPMGCGYGGAYLDAGVYQIYPYQNQMAQMDVELLTNAVVVAQNGYSQAIISIPYARSFSTNVCGFRGMMGSMVVHTVNGYPCNLSLSFTDTSYGQMCGY